MATRAQSTTSEESASLMIGAKRCCGPRRRNAEHDERDAGRDVGVQDLDGRDAADPHHRRSRIADDAARAARVRGRDDGHEVTDAHAPAKQRVRHRAADQRGRNVVEKP